MFRGNHPAKVDEKGRLKLPAAFKQLLDAQHVTQFYITSTDGQSAEIWPLPEWEKKELLLADFTMDEAVTKYLELTSYYGQQIEVDSQARLLLPQLLRKSAELHAEVTVRGMIDHLVVHNLAQVEQKLPESALTSDDRKSLAAKLSRKALN